MQEAKTPVGTFLSLGINKMLHSLQRLSCLGRLRENAGKLFEKYFHENALRQEIESSFYLENVSAMSQGCLDF